MPAQSSQRESHVVAQVDIAAGAWDLSGMPVRVSKNVSLTPELEAFVDGQVASGRYQTASEVIRAGLRLLQTEERRAQGGRSRPKPADAAPREAL